jgi:diguanylate cyclase (GGDEF)-like protein
MSRNIEERKRLEHELFIKASTDSLTGILTRSRFFELAETAFRAKPAQEGTPVLAILDLDNFKAINDRYGHVQGDRVLQSMGRICGAHLQNGEFLGRFGGDEFVIFFPDTTLDQGMEILENIREDIGRESFAFTMSAGIAACLSSDEGFETLLERADRALYAVKGSGRNGIISAA